MARLLVAAVLFLAAAGCSSGGKEPVSGTVTLKGQNLDKGTITFLDAKGSPSSTDIKDGAYSFSREKGLAPGKYRVSIDSPDGKTPEADPNAEPGPSGNFTSKNRIPAKYNTESKLEAEVKAGEKNEFKFEIP
jgi:hypothetical protein